MEKRNVLQAHSEYIDYLLSLQATDETKAHTPYAEGKWSPAQIIMHLAEWDRFTLEERLPLMEEGARLERFPEFEAFNQKAAVAAADMAFPAILRVAVDRRTVLSKKLEEMNSDWWNVRFWVGTYEMSPAEYFAKFVEHDRHHLKQIQSVLN